MISIKHFIALMLFLCITAISSNSQSIILIRFDDEYESSEQANLRQIENRIISELQNKGYTIITETKDAWEVEESYREKRDFVFSFDAQYSIELIYEKIPQEISTEFKNWTEQNYNLPAKRIRAGRLTKYQDPTHLQALAIEWSRDAAYFIKNGIIKRPEIAIEDFIRDQDDISQNVIELMVFMKNNLPLYYLNTKISDCIKLKQAELFEQCTSMRGHYGLNSNALNITVEFEDPQGEVHTFSRPNLTVPSSNFEYDDFTIKFIKLIDWPENLTCNE